MTLHLGDYRTTLADATWDALITDAPYSSRTHAGHDGATSGHDGRDRRTLSYASLSPQDVHDAVSFISPRTRGWMVSITDHILAPVWADAMEAHGRYVFAPVAWYAPGSRVRMSGDGPACWVCWIVVSRPRTQEFSRWGALPGGYLHSGERRGAVVGAKPLALMRDLVCDYSREGDVVCDPYAGGGTTLLAAQIEGRVPLGSEVDPDTHAIASARLAGAPPARQASIFDPA